MAQGELIAKIRGSVGAFAKAEWDALAGSENPFTSHAFLTALEDSGSVGTGTGWSPAPVSLEDANGALLGVMPSYLKGHSQGEYVFDHAWADAWHRTGNNYYPKLQISAPFTPATGPRLLIRERAYAEPLLRAAEQVVRQNGWSSAHATFIDPAQAALFEDAGWLRREDLQFHWTNHDYNDFDDFLGAMASRKRKGVRKERRSANEGVRIEALTGDDIKPSHWDAFWFFYQDTGARKWGTPYLTREAFTLFSERMADRLLLLLAYIDDEPVAGALNFIGSEALYGRYWGCRIDKPFLHFELCYYRAIEEAIGRGLQRVEAGAQGGHKLARGYAPVATISMHYLPDPGFSAAVEEFLVHERRGVSVDRLHLDRRTPFRKAPG